MPGALTVTIRRSDSCLREIVGKREARWEALVKLLVLNFCRPFKMPFPHGSNRRKRSGSALYNPIEGLFTALCCFDSFTKDGGASFKTPYH